MARRPPGKKPYLLVCLVLALGLAGALSSSSSCSAPADPGASPLRKPSAPQAASDPNRAGREERRAFAAEGWAFVQENPPDPSLQRLDPSLLKGREAELVTQLQSTALADDQLENAYRIALLAHERDRKKAQFVALEALGRSDSPAAQGFLRQAFDGIADEGARGQILGLLKPRNLDDESAQFLVRKLEDEALSDGLRAQAAFPVIVRALLDGHDELPARPIERLSPEWQSKVQGMFQLAARKTDRPAAHRHGGQ